jgi:hypothetical protein
MAVQRFDVDINMAGSRLLGLPAPISPNEPARVADIQAIALAGKQIPPPGEYVSFSTGPSSLAVGQNAALNANRLLVLPYVSKTGFEIDQLAVNVATNTTGAQIRFVQYGADLNGYPGALLFQSEAVDVSLTGPRSVTAKLIIPANSLMWLGIRTNMEIQLTAFDPSSTPDIDGGTAIQPYAWKYLSQIWSFSDSAPQSPWVYAAAQLRSNLFPRIWGRIAGLVTPPTAWEISPEGHILNVPTPPPAPIIGPDGLITGY